MHSPRYNGIPACGMHKQVQLMTVGKELSVHHTSIRLYLPLVGNTAVVDSSVCLTYDYLKITSWRG